MTNVSAAPGMTAAEVMTLIMANGFDGAYTSLAGKPALFSGLYADLSGKPTIPAAQIQADWQQSDSGALDYIKNRPAVDSQGLASRSLNSAFQISATRNAIAIYGVQITITASISGGQNGDVILEIASNSGFTSNVQTLSIAGNGQTYSLAIALQGIQPNTVVVFGWVPAGYYVRLRTVNNLGSPSYSYRSGQEVLN